MLSQTICLFLLGRQVPILTPWSICGRITIAENCLQQLIISFYYRVIRVMQPMIVRVRNGKNNRSVLWVRAAQPRRYRNQKYFAVEIKTSLSRPSRQIHKNRLLQDDVATSHAPSCLLPHCALEY